MDFETGRKGTRLRFGVLGYLGISSPIFCVPVYIAELVQIFKQTHKSRNKRNSWLWTCRPRTQIQQASWAATLLPPFLLLWHPHRLSRHDMPELLQASLRPTRQLPRAGWQRSSRRQPEETALSPCTCSAGGLVASEHPQGEEALWLTISALNSIGRNSGELVGNVAGRGAGHEIKFTPAKKKVSSGARLGFQTFWVCLAPARGAAALLAWGGRRWAAGQSLGELESLHLDGGRGKELHTFSPFVQSTVCLSST